jgi:hypothetical protein
MPVNHAGYAITHPEKGYHQISSGQVSSWPIPSVGIWFGGVNAWRFITVAKNNVRLATRIEDPEGSQ